MSYMNSKQIVITAEQVQGISTEIKMECINTNIYYEDDKSLKDSFELTIDNIDYRTEILSERGNKGANSIILKLYLADGYDTEDNVQRVLKVSKTPDNWTPTKGFSVPKFNRSFYREIECLQKCKELKVRNIIEIYSCGYIICKKKNQKGKEVFIYFPFYMMECADYDLKQFLENYDIDKEQKVALCKQLASGLGELHNIGCYHRDIKPDNILLINTELKIGDLGLIRYRDEDTEDAKGLIGPKGWISPEAMNKYLNEEKKFDGRINTEINEQSDIFQLGMVFWYIFQGNAPIGCIKRTDFFDENEMIFSLIKRMIYHSTEKRIKSIGEVKDELSRILEKV
ncbi:MAG: protein kinase family protein [Salinivirgaceae bacterium]|nr:protein kinase family protein [Salinivirgaceae bacterium]